MDESFDCKWDGYPSDAHGPEYAEVGRGHHPEPSICMLPWHQQTHGNGARCDQCGMTVYNDILFMRRALMPRSWLIEVEQRFTYGQPVSA